MTLAKFILFGHAADVGIWLLTVAWVALAIGTLDDVLAYMLRSTVPAAPWVIVEDVDIPLRDLLAAHDSLVRGDVGDARRELDRVLDNLENKGLLAFGDSEPLHIAIPTGGAA
jgi:hypothetical protein